MGNTHTGIGEPGNFLIDHMYRVYGQQQAIDKSGVNQAFERSFPGLSQRDIDLSGRLVQVNLYAHVQLVCEHSQ